jgi:hypothetical protein
MVLPSIRNTEYRYYYTNVQGFKILDNGVAEGKLYPIDTLIELAYAIGADEIIAPDVYEDMKGTLKALERWMPFLGSFDTMIVLQCRTWKEFDTMFNEALTHGPASLGLPRVMCKYLGVTARMAAAQKIRAVSDLPIHALGSTRQIEEGRWLARQGIVRGIDTSAPVVNGLRDEDLDVMYDTRQDNYFELKLNTQARRNIEQFRSWCADPFDFPNEETSVGELR